MADSLIPSTPRLPSASNAQDGDQVADAAGNVYIFNAETKEWVVQGQLEIPETVSLEQDGLVTPVIYRKLQLISQLRDQGFDFNSFRIDDKNELKPYFYYFYSSDGFVDFIPESSNKLRIEVDRGKLYRHLLRNCIKGPKGPKGDQGQAGRDGTAAANEVFRTPSLDSEGRLNLTAEVAVPIDTDISLRFFNSKNTQVAQLFIPLDESGIEVSSSSNVNFVPSASEISLTQSGESAVIEASILFEGNGTADIDEWRYKARQRGPKGAQGLEGLRRLEIVDQEFTDPLLRSTRAIVSLRKPNISNNISLLEQPIFDEICVPNLSPPSQVLPTGPILDTNFVAAQVSPNDCKDIGRYIFRPDDFTIPELDIPLWTPTADCVDSERFDQAQFRWYEDVDPHYVFSILPTPRPPAECCVAEGTMIHCADGLRPVEKLDVGSQVLCPDGEFRAIEKFFDNGVKECIKLSFSDGSSVICTPDHKFPVGGHLIEAQDLESWDQIHKAPGVLDYIKHHRSGNEEDYENGYMIGFLLGDGWITDKGIGIVSPDFEKESFDKARALLGCRFGYNTIQNRNSDNCVMLRTSWTSQKAIRHFRDRGWYKSLKERRIDIPDSIYLESYQFYRGLFTALINTDGCIGADGSVNLDWSALEILPKALKRLIDYLGIGGGLNHHTRSKNSKFKEVTDDDLANRVDIYRSDVGCLAEEFLSEDLLSHKRECLKKFVCHEREPFIFPLSRTSRYNSGLIVGAFTFLGGTNFNSNRAWISGRMPPELRQELSCIIDLNIPIKGVKFYKSSSVDKIKTHFTTEIDESFAAGFIRAALYRRDKLSPNGSLIIPRNDKDEFEFTKRCLDHIGIKYYQNEMSTPFGKKQYRITIRKSHNIYKALVCSGHRSKLYDFNLKPPSPTSGVVTVVEKESVGLRRVYDYNVGPHYMMMAEGCVLLDCQEDFFYCPNVGDQPCGITGTPSAPSRFNTVKADDRCECECESELELQGDGLQFPDLNKDDENVACCSIRGQTDVYNQTITIEGEGTIKVEINWEDEEPFNKDPDPCTESGPDDPSDIITSVTADTDCIDISSTMDSKMGLPAVYEFTVNSGGATTIVPGGLAEIGITGPTTTAVCPPCDVDLRISVNDTELTICRKYCVRITFTCDCAPPPETPTTPPTPPAIPPIVPTVGLPEEPFIIPEQGEVPPAITGPDEVFNPFDGDLDFRNEDGSLGTVGNRGLNIPDPTEPGANDFLSHRPLIDATLQCVRTDRINVQFNSLDIGTVSFPGGDIDPHDALARNSIVRPFTASFDRTDGSLQDGPFGSGYYFPQSGSFNYIVTLNGIDVRRDTYAGGYLFFPRVTSAADFPISGAIVSAGTGGITLRAAGSRWAQSIGSITQPGTSSFIFNFTSIDDITRACGEGSNVPLTNGTIINIYSEAAVEPPTPAPGPETPMPEIGVDRSGAPLTNGGADSVGDLEAGDETDFTYTLTNNGTGNLSIGTITSANEVNSSVDITQPGDTSLGAGESTTFTVGVTPTAAGAVSFDIDIPSNDADDDPFIFTVMATGTSPEIRVIFGKGSITDGGVSAVGAISKCNQTLTYTIINDGTSPLTIGTVSVSPLGNIDSISVSSAPSSPVAAGGGSTTLGIDIDPTSVGGVLGDVLIPNNDLDESPFNFLISGTATDPIISLENTTLSESIDNGDTHNLRGVESGSTDGGRTFTFTITNNGNEELNLTGSPEVSISNESNVTATVTSAPSTPISSSGGTTTFDIEVIPTADCNFSFDISIDNDDCDNDPFTATLEGAAVPVETEYYWPFDGDLCGTGGEYMGTTAFDGYGTATDAFCIGSGSQKFGDLAVAIITTGSGQLTFPDTADLDVSTFTDGIVLDFWYNIPTFGDSTSPTAFLELLDSSSLGIGFDFQIDTATGIVDPLVTIDTSGSPLSIDSDITASETWVVGDGYHHIRLFLDITSAAPEAYLWIDGFLVGSATGLEAETFAIVDAGADLEFSLEAVFDGTTGDTRAFLDNLAVFDIFPSVGTGVGTEDDFTPPTLIHGWITEGTM